MSRSAHAFALAVLLATASNASGAPLFSRARGVAALERVETPGIARAQPLQVDMGALGALRTVHDTRLDAFPLGRDRTVALAVTRFDPFPPHARVEVVEADGVRELPLPDVAYFRGTVEGEPESRVLLLAGTDEVRGFVASGGDVFHFGRRSGSAHVSYRLGDVDPAFFPPPGDFCSNDLHPEQVNVPAAFRPAALPPPVAELPLKVADVAIETDQELRAKFASDQATLDYLAALLAATTTIYERDVSVRLTFSYIRLWNTTDPWTATGTSGALSEFLNYWNSNMTGQPRDVAHMISGKTVQGGIAYVDVLCLSNWAYGVSQVYGSFDVSSPNDIWDVEVVAHELGHNFGSPHTHCYSPPVDKCYNGESGCYSGSVVPSQGTVMSYCHLNAGGLANIDLVFGDTVSARIGTSVAAASCLSTVTTTSTSATSSSSSSSTTTSSTSSTSTSRTSTTTSTSSTSTSSSTTSTSSTSTSSMTSTTSTTSSSSTTTSSSTTSTSSSSSTSSTATPTTSSSSSTSTSTTSTSSSTTPTSTTSTSSSSSTTSTARPTTTSSTSPSTTSSSSSTAVTAPSTSTSVTSTSSSTVLGSSSTVTTSTTSTTEPSARAGGDEDGDGITDLADACAGTPAGDLVTESGCSVCPCDGGVSGWSSRRAYLACVRGEARYRVAAGSLDAVGRRYAIQHSRKATCGRPTRTRCCLPTGACAVVTEPACATRGGTDLGAGSCLPSPCD